MSQTSIQSSRFNFSSAWVALILVVGLSAGCVSVNLGPKSAEKSRGVNYTAPAKPFERISETRADEAWINRVNGNSISYLSSCNDPADPSIEFASRELLAGLGDFNTIKSETVRYNSREALVNEVQGKLEGVLTRISSVVFKKNGCLYSITYIGVPKFFEEDRGRFDNFLRGFQAP